MSDSVRPFRQQPTRLPRPWDSPGKNTGVGCHFLLQCMKVESESEVAQLCQTLHDPMDCSPPGSCVHGIFRQEYWSGVPSPSPDCLAVLCKSWVGGQSGRILTILTRLYRLVQFSSVQSLSRVRLFETPWTTACQAPPSMGFSGKSTGVGCHYFLC